MKKTEEQDRHRRRDEAGDQKDHGGADAQQVGQNIEQAGGDQHRREDQDKPFRALKSLKLDEAGKAGIMHQLEKWNLSEEWTKDAGQYVPSITKFLRDSKYRLYPPRNAKTTASKSFSAEEYENHYRNDDRNTRSR